MGAGSAHRALPLVGLLLLAACGGQAPRLGGGGMECAPYARAVSGIALRGAAASWWAAADGRYGRASSPAPGAVLVFRATDRLPSGHVSVVRQVTSPRSILVEQANWVHGRIGRDEPVVDVSPLNDWTAVRVWWAPAGQMGSSTYPTFGFILPQPAGGEDGRQWMAARPPAVRPAGAWNGGAGGWESEGGG